jgi:hypothetical protein
MNSGTCACRDQTDEMDDEGQHGFRLPDPRQAEVRGWPEPALLTDCEHNRATGRRAERPRGRHEALALELAPVRVNLIQAGFVDTALAASYFADETALEARRDELRATLPIRRVVGPVDIAALAVTS